MKIVNINRAYIPETIMRGCDTPVYVRFHENEIGLVKQEKWIARIMTSDAIIGVDPLTHLYVCLALDGRLAWSRGYKTIRAAIRNAFYC